VTNTPPAHVKASISHANVTRDSPEMEVTVRILTNVTLLTDIIAPRMHTVLTHLVDITVVATKDTKKLA
jgi:hypothetical protein